VSKSSKYGCFKAYLAVILFDGSRAIICITRSSSTSEKLENTSLAFFALNLGKEDLKLGSLLIPGHV